MENQSSRGASDSRRERAKLARQNQRATKAWELEARAAVAGSIWRVGSVWIEETSNTACAEFINASNGKTHALKLTAFVAVADRRTEVQRLLSINAE
jgi:hypothetical protein